MSVRNDHELPRAQADASDDSHTWSDYGPLEVQEAIESIVASLPVMAEHVSSIPRWTEGDCAGGVGKALPANRIKFGLF
jgi:hypothetical protein